MAFKSADDGVPHFNSQPISWRKNFLLFAPLACYLAIIFYPASGFKDFLSADLPALVILCVITVGVFWYGKRNPKKRYLVVMATELKQVYGSKEFSYPWREIHLVQINKNGQGKVIGLSILMQSGKLWNVSGYADMDTLAKEVTKYAKTGRIDGLLNSIRTKPWIRSLAGNILMITCLLGWRLFPKQIPLDLVFIPVLGILMWLYPTKTGSVTTKRLSKHYLFGLLLLLGLIVISVVILRVFAR